MLVPLNGWHCADVLEKLQHLLPVIKTLYRPIIAKLNVAII